MPKQCDLEELAFIHRLAFEHDGFYVDPNAIKKHITLELLRSMPEQIQSYVISLGSVTRTSESEHLQMIGCNAATPFCAGIKECPHSLCWAHIPVLYTDSRIGQHTVDLISLLKIYAFQQEAKDSAASSVVPAPDKARTIDFSQVPAVDFKLLERDDITCAQMKRAAIQSMSSLNQQFALFRRECLEDRARVEQQVSAQQATLSNQSAAISSQQAQLNALRSDVIYLNNHAKITLGGD